MGTLFRDISSKSSVDELSCVFDWLFDDGRFQGACWGSKVKAKFTKRVRKLNGMGPGSFGFKSKKLGYPSFATKRNRKKKPIAVITGSSLGVDLVRHIRNGIAHGNAELYKANGKDYIEIKDFSRKTQSAYIAMPLDYLSKLYAIYQEIEDECTTVGRS